MTVRDIFDFLNSKFPVSTAEAFDNAGILVGNPDGEVTAAVAALDCTRAALKLAVDTGAQLIVTHHPVIFEPLKALPYDSMPAALVKAGISVISMHTNLDTGTGGVNDALCASLRLHGIKSILSGGFQFRIGETESALNPGAFAEYVSDRLRTPVRYTEGSGKIKRVAVCSGSGGSFLDDAIAAGAHALVTGDVKHSVFMEADMKRFTVIDAGHFYTEDVIVEPLAALLRGQFPQLEISTCHDFSVKTVPVLHQKTSGQ